MIEQILDEKGVHINHNRIHKIMLEEGLAKPNLKKQKKRKYKCYERKHSLSLVHTDWAEYKGMKFISPPNIITKKLIVPELRGVLKPQDVAKEALILLKNSKTREKISQELKKIAKQRGAADNIAKIILNI